MNHRPRFSPGILLVAGLFCWLAVPAIAGQDSTTRTRYDIGLSASVFSNVDVRDVEVAMEVLLEELVDKREQSYVLDMEVYEDIDLLRQSIDRGQVHMVCLPTIEYLALRESHSLEPAWIFQMGGEPAEEYLLLARNDSELVSAVELLGREVALPQGVTGEIAALWLNELLNRAENTASIADIGGIAPLVTPSKAILRVFFSQSSACVVPAWTYDLVVELNPQVGRELRVLDRSPGLLRAVMCYSGEVDPVLKKKMTEFVTTMHRDAEGRQVLVMQQVERMLPFAAWMIEALELLHAQRPVEWDRYPAVRAVRRGGLE